MLREWMRRLLALCRRSAAIECDVDEELQFHLEQQITSYQRQGFTPDEANRRARVTFGTFDLIKEEHRDVRRPRLVEDFRRDVRYAARQLWRSPSFAAAAILCLGLGIGAVTTISSVMNTVLFQPLPFPDSDRLVRVVENVQTAADRPLTQRGITYQEFLDWRSRTKTLVDCMAFVPLAQRMVRTPQGATGLWGAATSSNTFALLGVQAIVGRTLTPDDDADPNVVVLSFDTWRTHFNADGAVLGATIELRAATLQPPIPPQLLTVVGVLPADFELPTGLADFYTPIRPPNAAGRSPQVTMIGRVAPDVPLAVAADEANALGTAIRPPRPVGAPALPGSRFEIQSLKDLAVEPLRPALRILLGAVVVVLLIVCANVANLLLARGVARQREMSLRLAIGAGRGRMIRQLMSESLVLALAGGAVGALIGAAGVMLVKQLATVDAPGIFRLTFGATILPRAHEVGVDLRVLSIALITALGTSLVFGVAPAWYLSRTRHGAAMGSRGSGGRLGDSRVRAILVVGQLALATVLLVGAGLLTNSFVKLSTINKGYDASNVLAFQLLFPDQYSTARKADTIATLLAGLRRIPTVRFAGFARHGVLIGEELRVGTFVPPGRTLEEMRTDPARPRVRSVSDGFLTAMGVPLLQGRDFQIGDVATAPPVIVINRSAARRFFSTDNPVGQPVAWHLGETPVQTTVVGVVEDIRQESLDDETYPEVFVDYRQLLFLTETSPEYKARQNEWAIGFLSFAIRTSGDPTAAIPMVRQLINGVDPNVGIDAMVPMSRLVAGSVARQRFYAVTLDVFAAIAGVLAAIGVYGVLAYAVVQRRQEIGIRMALGSQRSQVLALVLRKGLILTTIGIAVGVAGALAGARLLQGLLFGITPLDAQTFLTVGVMFFLVTTLASYLPARRAVRVDPMVALRCD